MENTVAIVIPCFNHGRYLGEAVHSALSQTRPADEIIVVDDASDEATAKVCRQLQSDRVRVIRHETNKGLAAARNTGIASAKSWAILPLDADDRIAPTFLEETVPVLAANADCGWVYVDCVLFGERGGFIEFPEYEFKLLLAHDLCLASSLFRKSDWERCGGYDVAFRQGQEDWDFFIGLARLGLAGRRVARRLFEYRQHGDSMRSRSHAAIEISAEALWAKHREVYERHAETLWKYYVGRFFGSVPNPFRSESRERLRRRLRRKLLPK